jgi:hypothetical protein
MDADERALRILDEISRAPRETGPVTLSPEYVDAIAQTAVSHGEIRDR